jgi:uncharacterized protein (DUF427 family)
MKAIYKDNVIAESPETLVIENDHYFPVESVNMDLLKKNGETGACVNEGDACYYDVRLNGFVLKDAASSFSRPLEASEKMRDYIVFGDEIEIVE